MHTDTLYAWKLCHWHLDAFFGKHEPTHKLYFLSKPFLYLPTFWIQLHIKNYRKPRKLFKRFMLNKNSISNSSVEADAWNNKIPDEAPSSAPSWTTDSGEKLLPAVPERPRQGDVTLVCSALVQRPKAEQEQSFLHRGHPRIPRPGLGSYATYVLAISVLN